MVTLALPNLEGLLRSVQLFTSGEGVDDLVLSFPPKIMIKLHIHVNKHLLPST